MVLTLIISVPAMVLFLNWMHTLWNGAIRLDGADAVRARRALRLRRRRADRPATSPTSRRTSTCTTPTSSSVTSTSIMAAAVFLGSFAAIYFWFPKMFGRMMSRTLGTVHFWLTLRAARRHLRRHAASRQRRHAATPLRPVGVRDLPARCSRWNVALTHIAYPRSARRSCSSSTTSSRRCCAARQGAARIRGRWARSSGPTPTSPPSRAQLRRDPDGAARAARVQPSAARRRQGLAGAGRAAAGRSQSERRRRRDSDGARAHLVRRHGRLPRRAGR